MAVGLAQGGVALVQLASIPLLSRLLVPEDFGLIAMSLVFTGFARMFIDAGLAVATVQRNHITPAQISNLFWISTALGFLAMTVTMALSPVIALLYGKGELTAITIALAIPFLFSGLSIQHTALLRRNMQFETLARIQVSGFLIGTTISVLWAWTTRSYWALVVQPLVTSAWTMLTVWIVTGWRPSWPQKGVGTQDMTYFGLAVFASNIVNYVALNVDKLLVGYFAGPVALGLYDRAYRFLLMPLQKVNGPLGSVVMPALSRLNQRPYEYQQVYNTAAIILIFVAAPIAAVAVAAPTWCVNVIFGPGWEAMVPIFQILAIGIVLQPIFNSLGWLLISQGRAKEQFYALSAEGVLRIVLVTIGSLWGPIGIACAATARLFLSLPLLFQLVGRRQTYPVRALWKVFGLAIACGLVSFIAVLPILKLAPFSTAPLVQLLLLATIAVLASISVLAVFSTSRRAAHQLFAELQKMLNRA